ncbi:MAG: polymerase, sigma-24 subunit, subfamily [Solirubrobacterales bacterium]|nr:polymerase, sigma-24 subunit, subfamily [Solirubrobacterales bacterium]
MYPEPNGSAEVRRLATALFTERRDFLLRIARKHARGGGDPEEALQDAFVAFIRHFDPNGEAPALPWLVLTLKRQCWRLREQAHLERYAGQEAEPGTGERGFVLAAIPSRAPGPEQRVLEGAEASRRLERLKPDERDAVILQAAGYTYEEIAAGRGWSQTKIKRCMYEGRAALKTAAAG